MRRPGRLLPHRTPGDELQAARGLGRVGSLPRGPPPHVAPPHQRAPHRILETVVLHLAFDEVGDDLGVGFRDETVPLPLQLVLEIEIILDDAVVDDDDASGAVAVRMRVFFSGPSVRGPACVADAVVAPQRLVADDTFKIGQLARASPKFHAAAMYDGDDESARHLMDELRRRFGRPGIAGRQRAPYSREHRLIGGSVEAIAWVLPIIAGGGIRTFDDFLGDCMFKRNS